MKTCPKCGADKNPDDANFCGHCGMRFDGDAKIAAEVRDALRDMKATWYTAVSPRSVQDSNSMRIFAKLQRACGVSAIPYLVDTLKDGDALTRWKAMLLLTYFRFAGADVYREFWQNETEVCTRRLMVDFIIARGNEVAFRKLLVLISAGDDDIHIRCVAIRRLRVLARQGVGEAIQSLLDGVYDQHVSVRQEAFSGLSELRNGDILEFLVAQIGSPNMDATSARAIANPLLELRHAKCLELILGGVLEACQGNDYLVDRFIVELIPRCISQFGREQVLATAKQISDTALRDKIDNAVRLAK